MRVDPVFLDRVAAKDGERLAVLSCEESLRDDLDITEEAVQTSISVLLGQHHAVIVDVPRVAAAPYRWVLDNADFRVIVADQTLQSARDATRLRAALAEDVDHRNLLVINRAGEAGRRAVPLKEMESVLELRPNFVIPYEPASFAKAINSGKPAGGNARPFPARDRVAGRHAVRARGETARLVEAAMRSTFGRRVVGATGHELVVIPGDGGNGPAPRLTSAATSRSGSGTC